jgi:hypothetical protein
MSAFYLQGGLEGMGASRVHHALRQFTLQCSCFGIPRKLGHHGDLFDTDNHIQHDFVYPNKIITLLDYL